MLGVIVAQDELSALLVGLLGGCGAGRVVGGGAINGNDAAAVRTANTSLDTGVSLFHGAQWRGP